jgi:hypothetical protein
MKTTMITLALLMGLSSHAQTQPPTPVPTVWQCSADCFTLGGSDGANLYYYGNVKGYAYLSKSDAFHSLKNSCSGSTLLLKRILKGVYNQNTVENIFQRDVSYYWRGYSERGEHLSSDQHSKQSPV